MFDAARRLVRIGPITYAYDAHGRRVTSTAPGEGTRYQVYSRSGQLLHVEDTARDQRIDYVHLGSTLVARRTRPLTMDTATTTYLHTDHRGTPSVESNSSGTMSLRNRLNPWGEPYDGIWREGTGFTAHAADEHARLVYMQQRYYDPLAMRFLSIDPIGAGAGSFNRYCLVSTCKRNT